MPRFQVKVPVERYEWFVVEANNEQEALSKAKHGVRETHEPIDEYNEQRWDVDPVVECEVF